MFQRESGQRGRHARDRGATAVEYGLILSGVALATAVAIVALRPVLSSALGSASDSQAILSDGSTATPPAGGGAPPPTTATPTPTTPTPTPTPTTPTPTPTTPTPTPTPTQPAGSTAIVPGAAKPVQIDINPNLPTSFELATCTFSPALKPATAQFTYNDITSGNGFNKTSNTMTFSAPATATHAQAITATCTFSTSGQPDQTRKFSLWVS
jgi:Flp pilus assembly pilin Flp